MDLTYFNCKIFKKQMERSYIENYFLKIGFINRKVFIKYYLFTD